MTVAVSKVETVAEDINEVESQANQNAITVNNLGNNEYGIAVTGTLNSFASTNPGQGIGQWIGLVVDTGEDDIKKVKYNGVAFTENDVIEAATLGIDAGKFVWWIKAETLPKQIVLTTDGKAETIIKIKRN